jgi:hypothetical protein
MRWPALACCLVLALPACGGAERERFASPVYGYTLELPTGWSALAAGRVLDDGEPPATAGDPPATDVLSSHPDRRVHDMALPGLVIGAQEVAAGTTPDAWADAVIVTARFMKGCDAPASRKHRRVGGVDAVVLDYPTCPRSGDFEHWWVTAVSGGRGFHIVVFDHQCEAVRAERALDAVLDGLDFG